MQVLIEKAANLHATNSKGEEVLEVAEKEGNQQILALLKRALAGHGDEFIVL